MSWFTKKTPTIVTPERGERVEIEQTGWISVSDKLPESMCRVLLSSPEFGVITGHRYSQCKEGASWELGVLEPISYSMYRRLVTTCKVTHWMPLPPSAT